MSTTCPSADLLTPCASPHARGEVVRSSYRSDLSVWTSVYPAEFHADSQTCTRLGTISQDPIGFAAGDANLYRYVRNGPTNKVDPSGLVDQNSPEAIELRRKEAERRRAQATYDKEMDRFHRELFDYYQRLMHLLVLVGDELAYNGINGVTTRYPWLASAGANCTDSRGAIASGDGESSLYVIDSLDRRHPFPIHWGRLRDAIQYSQTEYGDFDDWWLVDAGSLNLHGLGIPIWIRLNQEQFYGRDNEALQDMIHEPLHDLRKEGGVWPWRGHSAIKDIVPTGRDLHNRPIGGKTTSPYGSDWEQYFNFLQNTNCGGVNMWDRIREWAGPRPTRPTKPNL